MFRLLKCESCNLRRYMLKQTSEIKCACLVCFRSKSYYNVLGIDSTASPKDIKSAYYKLSLQHHPDKNNGCPDSVAKFREITEAYEVLSNPEKKRKYDLGTNFERNDFYNKTYSRRDYQAKNFRGPFTGKTKDFDYDEHYRRHYEDVERQRQAEYEYFKRRWEADFHDRYPNFKDYYYRQRDPQPEREKEFEKFRHGLKTQSRFYIFFVSTACFMLLVQFLSNMFNPEKIRVSRRVYYEVADENDHSRKKEDQIR